MLLWLMNMGFAAGPVELGRFGIILIDAVFESPIQIDAVFDPVFEVNS